VIRVPICVLLSVESSVGRTTDGEILAGKEAWDRRRTGGRVPVNAFHVPKCCEVRYGGSGSDAEFPGSFRGVACGIVVAGIRFGLSRLRFRLSLVFSGALAALISSAAADELATHAAPVVSFVGSAPEATFGLADSEPALRGEAPRIAIFTAGAEGRAARGRVAIRGSESEASPIATAPLPRPPAKDAIRTLTLAFDLLEPTDERGFARRFGRWRLEAAVAEGATDDSGTRGAWTSSYDREIGIRLRGWGLSRRIRTNLAIVRAKGPGPARVLEWSDGVTTGSETTETIEAAYDVVRDHPLWSERAASLTVTARRSSFAAPLSNASMSFVETEELFAANGHEPSADAVVLAGWRVPHPDQMITHRVAEEIASANLRLSLFPWLPGAAAPKGWRASIDHGFERVRPWRGGRAGEPENVQSIGASWSTASSRLAVRHAVCTEGVEADRVADEVRLNVRPLAAVGVQVSAAKVATPAHGDVAARDAIHVDASTSVELGRGWNVWSGARASETDCGEDCELEVRALDAQLSRRLGLVVDGRRIPVRVFAGASAERVANAAPGQNATDEDRWSVGTGISVTF
jgi:hypothetical protein